MLSGPCRAGVGQPRVACGAGIPLSSVLRRRQCHHVDDHGVDLPWAVLAGPAPTLNPTSPCSPLADACRSLPWIHRAPWRSPRRCACRLGAAAGPLPPDPPRVLASGPPPCLGLGPPPTRPECGRRVGPARTPRARRKCGRSICRSMSSCRCRRSGTGSRCQPPRSRKRSPPDAEVSDPACRDARRQEYWHLGPPGGNDQRSDEGM